MLIQHFGGRGENSPNPEVLGVCRSGMLTEGKRAGGGIIPGGADEPGRDLGEIWSVPAL